jgi:hypothetical protein
MTGWHERQDEHAPALVDRATRMAGRRLRAGCRARRAVASSGAMFAQRLALALVPAALAGCATLDVYQVEPARSHRAGGPLSPAGKCALLFEIIDRAVDASEVRDALASLIAGFAYLRASRFLASFAGEPLREAAFGAWMTRREQSSSPTCRALRARP